MGRVVTFAQLTPQKSDGVGTAPITRDDVREMSASYLRVEPGKSWRDRAPDGSDCYLFVLNGSGAITSDNARHAISRESFATIQEGHGFAVENNGTAPLEMVRVLAPPNGGRGLPGFHEKLRVAERRSTPLDGALEFTVNGEQAKVAPGQAAYFAMNDTHGLHVAPGHSGASFLEFHIPAA